MMNNSTTKNPKRVPKHYEQGTKDWDNQFNMLLPDGKTCSDCVFSNKCLTLFDQEIRNTSCQFYPNRFRFKG